MKTFKPPKFNDYILMDDHAVIIIYSKNKKYECLVDLNDLEKLKKLGYRWTVNHGGYAYFKTKENRTVIMHRYLIDAPDDNTVVVDHINHNRLDNRQQNLRIVTKNNNAFNRKGAPSTNKTSGVRGVCYDAHGYRTNRWKAYFSINGKRTYLGRYFTKQEAEQVVLDARSKIVIQNLNKNEKRS